MRIDAIDRASLSITGSRGHREVGVASGLQQDRNFVVDATPLLIAPRIAESPVAMDETVDDFACCRVLSQHSMTVEQDIAKQRQLSSSPSGVSSA
jgi:hypothetical protein